MTARIPSGLLLLATIAACDRAGTSTKADMLSGLPAAAPAAGSISPAELTRAVGLVDGGRPASANEQTFSSQAASGQEIVPGSMLVRVGQASVQVDSLNAGIARVRDLARRTGAIVANTSMEGGREQTRAASLELRIPSERFDDAINGLAPIGKLESVKVNVQDVGEEFVDVQARVTNARHLEQRLVDLLATRTGKLADVLSVERELARVREEIERYEGRLRYLRSRAAVSTLTIAVHEPFPIVAERPGARPIRDAFIQAWRNLLGFTAGFIALLGILVPLGALGIGLVIVARRLVPGLILRLIPRRTTPDAGGA